MHDDTDLLLDLGGVDMRYTTLLKHSASVVIRTAQQGAEHAHLEAISKSHGTSNHIDNACFQELVLYAVE